MVVSLHKTSESYETSQIPFSPSTSSSLSRFRGFDLTSSEISSLKTSWPYCVWLLLCVSRDSPNGSAVKPLSISRGFWSSAFLVLFQRRLSLEVVLLALASFSVSTVSRLFFALTLRLRRFGVRHIEHSIISDKFKKVQAAHDQGGKPDSATWVYTLSLSVDLALRIVDLMSLFESHGGIIIDSLDKLWTIAFPVACGSTVCPVLIGDVIWAEPKEICDDSRFTIPLILPEFTQVELVSIQSTPVPYRSILSEIYTSSRPCPLILLMLRGLSSTVLVASSIFARGVKQMEHSKSCPSFIKVQALQCQSVGGCFHLLPLFASRFSVFCLGLLAAFRFLLGFCVTGTGATWEFLKLSSWKSSAELSS